MKQYNLINTEWLQKNLNTNSLIILEAGWQRKQDYLAGHIPGAIYMGTEEIESGPHWNLLPYQKIKEAFESKGISLDSTVVVYGKPSTAAARIAWVLMYMGIEKVFLLNGGYQAWRQNNGPTEISDNQGSYVRWEQNSPVNPQYLGTISMVKENIHNPKTVIVDIRSWDEHIGAITGYPYIDKKGRISNSQWGYWQSTPYKNKKNEGFWDGSLNNCQQLLLSWQQYKISPESKIIFYCGTGWRASLAFFYAKSMGWQDVCMYDGGWLEWSMDLENPIDTGIP